MNTPTREGIFVLADGRRLEYTDWGDADTPSVVYCHGFPGGRRELDLLTPELDRRAVGARVVAINRPGYGASTFQPGRKFVDWPADVAEVADHLGIGNFAVLGVSGGAPYALACGDALGDRVTSIGVVVGLAPLEATGMESATAISGPSSIGLMRRIQFGMAAFAFRKDQQDRFIEQSIASLGHADQETINRPEVRSWFEEVMREAFTQGGRGAAHEAGLYRESWGFDLARITVDTHLWYGGRDETVPASVGRWLHDRLPESTYAVWPEHGHFTWMCGAESADVVAFLNSQSE